MSIFTLIHEDRLIMNIILMIIIIVVVAVITTVSK